MIFLRYVAGIGAACSLLFWSGAVGTAAQDWAQWRGPHGTGVAADGALDLEGKPVWQRHLGREIAPFEVNWSHSSSPTLFEDTLILLCDHEPASCLLVNDARTGERIWQQRAAGVFSVSPVAGDGKVYFVSETGAVVVMAGGRQPELLTRNEIDERIFAIGPRQARFRRRRTRTHTWACWQCSQL